MSFIKTIFDKVKGFPESYFRSYFPKRIPGAENYEFWLRCLIVLFQTKQKNRVQIIETRHINQEKPSNSIWGPNVLMFHSKLRAIQEIISLIHLAKSLSLPYWPTITRRITQKQPP